MGHPPLSLNPRKHIDATSQRLSALIYFGLTRLDRELRIAPGLAETWSVSPDGKRWTFHIRAGLTDHRGDPITATGIRDCLEQYRIGRPVSPMVASFPQWRSTRVVAGNLVMDLDAPDPYVPRNLSSLRYFRTEAEGPCREPGEGEKIWGSGPFRAKEGFIRHLSVDQAFPSLEITLVPTEQAARLSTVTDPSAMTFRFIRDENTRLLWLLRGEVDGVLNGFSLSKTGWIRDRQALRFRVLEREAVTVEYLSFNLKDPVLSDIRVRRAIALALDRETIVRHKHANLSQLAGSFLPPSLAESHGSVHPHDLKRATRLLDDAGLKPDSDGIRLRLRFQTSSNEIGIERALIFREMLRKAGIELTLHVVEPSVFFSLLNKGAFQLYASRWIGASDGSIYLTTLHSRQPRNRVGYADTEMDRMLEAAMREMNDKKRVALLRKIQQKMNDDLPYLPLWFWKNSLVLDRRLGGLSDRDLPINGALEVLSGIKRPQEAAK